MNQEEQEQLVRRQLREVAEKQEENQRAIRKWQEAQSQVELVYAQEDRYLEELMESFHASTSAGVLRQKQEDARFGKQRSAAWLEEQLEHLQAQKEQLIEKERAIMEEKRLLQKEEETAYEY